MHKKQKIIIIAGTFYPNVMKLFEAVQSDVVVILHKENPRKVNEDYFKEELPIPIFLVASNKELQETILSVSPNVIISLGWRFILRKDFFEKIQSLIKINIHPALLPMYKGYHTEPFILMNNEREHGITAHHLTEELDGGDIILQESFLINGFSTVRSIKKQVNMAMPNFISALIKKINSPSFFAYPQLGEVKVVAPKRTPEDSLIDSSKTLDQLYDCIRASDPEFYPAYFIRDGEKVFIKLWTNRQSENEFEL